MSFLAYDKKKTEVLEAMGKCRNLVSNGEVKEAISYRINSLDNHKFKIAVFGNYSVGKSKFLNALMEFDKEILKEDELACTATITRLVQAENDMLNKANVRYKSGHERVIDIEDLASYSAVNEENKVEEMINEVVLNLESKYLENGIEIIDTPGFNSTHAIHTDIAKTYVREADASIFLFAANKAGTTVEYNFLRDINEYIHRVFFVMNKIDLCAYNNEKPSELIKNLENTLVNNNIEYHNKVIYPISAKKQHEGIIESSKEKMEESNFDMFTTSLTDYLTSEENIKDRLFVPLDKVEVEATKKREFFNDKLKICNEEKEEVNRIIKEKTKVIEDLEDSIKDKRKHVKSQVNTILRRTITEFNELTEELKKEIKTETASIDTEFQLELVDFSQIVVGAYDKYIRCWNKARGRLEDDIEVLIDEIVDDEDEAREVRITIMERIHNSLGIEKIEAEEPTLDSDAVKKLDDEIKVKRQEYLELRESLRDAKSNEVEYEETVDSIKRLKQQIDSLEESSNVQVNSIGYGKRYKTTKSRKETRQREGALGNFLNWFDGGKREDVSYEYIDDTDMNERREIRQEIQLDYDAKIKAKQEKLNELVTCRNGIEYDDDDVQELRKELEAVQFDSMQKQQQAVHNKDIAIGKMISINLNKFNKKVNSIIGSYFDETRTYLRKNKDAINRVISEVISIEEKDLHRQKVELQDMRFISNKTPEELEKEANQIHKEIIEMNEIIEIIRESKEAI